MRVMDIKRLMCLVATVDSGSYAATGRALFMSASTVARAVHDLEEEYHLQLMGGGGKAESTKEGLGLCEAARELLSAVERFEEKASALNSSATLEPLRLAIAETPIRGRVVSPSILEAFESAHAAAVLSCSWAPSGVCLAAVEDGRMDAAIVLGDVAREGLASVELFAISLSAALWKGDPLASQDSVALGELASRDIAQPRDLRYCEAAITDAFHDVGIEPRYVDTGPSRAEHRGLLEGGGAFLVFDEPEASGLGPDVVFLPIRGGQVVIPVHLIYPASTKHADVDALAHFLIKHHHSTSRRQSTA